MTFNICTSFTIFGTLSKKRQISDFIKEKVIHMKNAVKSDKSDLYTKLYTLSTAFYVNHVGKIMVTTGTDVL